MGLYLNSKKPCENYRAIAQSAWFVDKTKLLEELLLLIEQDMTGKYVCITRPRRFGKTVMASMVASYFGKRQSTREIFGNLRISSCKWYEDHLNRHNVIYISLNEIPKNCTSYRQYIDRIQEKLLSDLMREFPEAGIEPEDALWDAFNTVYEQEDCARFIFVLDEWDYIFHKSFVTDREKIEYIEFLSNLLKDQPYLELAYMTGILPIAKYSSGSELNMFCEYTMVSEEKYSAFFGFTDLEVDALFRTYQGLTPDQNVTRQGLKEWYDGYHTRSGERVYNPRSVVFSLANNNLGNYWTSSGPYDEIYYYIEKNTADVRDDLALMVAGIPVPARIREYAATSMNLCTKDEIFSAMVVYGFLSYENGCVSIPNRELMGRFDDMLRKEPELGYVYRLARESERMLRATLAGDTGTMVEILEFAHNTEIPLLSYNSEAELTTMVNLLYLSARDSWRVEREDKAGVGYVDFIFYPESDRTEDGIILELKIDHTPQEALRQIREKQYALRFSPRMGEKRKFRGRILAVGISYDRKTKKHDCLVEVLKEKSL